MTGALTGAALPIALVKESALAHNVRHFQAYCDAHGAALAPHVKTTMSPEIARRQREAGAWGATVASVPQAAIVDPWGFERMLIANQVTDPAGVDWLVDRAQAPGDVRCWIDSADGIGLLADRWHAVGARETVPVVLELGHDGGRTGVRSDDEAHALARAIAAEPALALTGVACFEGTLTETVLVDAFLARVAAVAGALADEGLLDPSDAIATAGGSAYFDRVIVLLEPLAARGFTIVLRSGCYVTHDCGVYDELSPMGSDRGGGLRPALEVWGAVVSTPEPGLALVCVGRRDASYDAGLPVPIAVRRRGGAIEPLRGLAVSALNDQHAYVRGEGLDLRVGDLVGFGISHPCTTFDKWRELTLVDDDYRALGQVTTSFP